MSPKKNYENKAKQTPSRKSFNDMKSLNEDLAIIDDIESIKSPTKFERNHSVKRLLTQRSIIKKNGNTFDGTGPQK